MMRDDQDELGYEEIIEQLENCPITYLPALLIKLAEIVYSRGVLKPRGASRLVLKVEAKLGMDQAE
jgi:hypothetical protein